MSDIISNPNFSISTWESEKIFYNFLHTQNIKIRVQNNHTGKKNGSFFLKTTLQASNPKYLFTHEQMDNYIDTDVPNNDHCSSLHNWQSWKQPS